MLERPLATEDAEAQLCQAQRMEIVGRLTGGVVHDFNNILTVITGTIEILAESVADRPDLAAIAGLIADAAARGGNLTSHLLAFSRGQPSKPREVDANALLVEATRLLRPTLGEQIEIESVLGADIPPVLVDSSRLMTAILNLAIMVREAMPQGGRLSFETRNAAAGESSAGTASAMTAADHVVIVVSASGHGAKAYLDRVMTDPGIVHNFITQSDGHVKIRGDAGRGSSVEIYLPRIAGVVPTKDEARKADIEGGDEAILIVEDDSMVRKFVVGQVQSLGYRTLVAADVGEALAILNESETIDLLLTDVMMPGSMNGRQLAIKAVQHRPALKVLYTSGYSESAMLHDGFLDASVLMLAKPYRKVDLAKMIRTALAG